MLKVQYDGLWQNELREGSGYFHLPEGIHYNGNWTNNKLTGTLNRNFGDFIRKQ